MDPVTGGLLSAGLKGGIGLVSGLLGGRSARKAYARQRADMLEDRLNTGVHAVEAAERSGFNPLTMLGAMGATNLGVQMGDTAPPLASVQLMTNALEEGMSELTGEASQKRARNELELDLAKLKLERAKVEGEQAALRASAGAKQNTFRSLTQIGSENVTYSKDRTAYKVGGKMTNPDKGWSDAEEIEKRSGDLWGSIYGLGVTAADAMNTFAPVNSPVNNAGANKKDTSSPFDPSQQYEEDRYWRGIYGQTPDGYTADGMPFWRTTDGKGTQFTPPNYQISGGR